MWIIQKVVRKEGGYVPALPANGGAQFYLKPNSSFKVGRQVQTDPPCLVTGGLCEQGEEPNWKESVSRKHAEVTYTSTKGVAQGQSIGSTSGGSTTTKLTLKDLGSKAGTFVRKQGSKDLRKLAPNEVYEIQDKDIVRFGMLACFQFVKVKFSLCFSRFSGAELTEKNNLVALCGRLGIARQVENAEDATHIVCSKISATVKVLVAVVMQKPIVNAAWLQSFAASTLPYIPIPPTDPLAPEFQPPSSSKDAINNASLSRATLLSSLCVLLADEADKKYEPVLRGAGATIIVLPAAEADLAATRLVIPPQCSSLCLFENNEAKESAERARYLSRLQLCRAVAGKQASPRPVLVLTTSEAAKAVMQMHVPTLNSSFTTAPAPGTQPPPPSAADAPSSAPAPKAPAGQAPFAALGAAEAAAAAARREALNRKETVLGAGADTAALSLPPPPPSPQPTTKAKGKLSGGVKAAPSAFSAASPPSDAYAPSVSSAVGTGPGPRSLPSPPASLVLPQLPIPTSPMPVPAAPVPAPAPAAAKNAAAKNATSSKAQQAPVPPAPAPVNASRKSARPAPTSGGNGNGNGNDDDDDDDDDEEAQAGARGKRGAKRRKASPEEQEERIPASGSLGQRSAEEEAEAEEEEEEEEEAVVLEPADINDFYISAAGANDDEEEEEDEDGWCVALRGQRRREVLQSIRDKAEREAPARDGDDGEGRALDLAVEQPPVFKMNPSTIRAALLAPTAKSSVGPDFRKFRKNLVMHAREEDRVSVDDMILVELKESERMAQNRQYEAEREEKEAGKDKNLGFLDRFGEHQPAKKARKAK